MLRQLVVLLALVSVALAAVSILKLEPIPDKFKDVEGCFIPDLDKVIPFGESAPCHMHCMEYRCSRENVRVATCGSYSATPPCTLEEDHTKPYPDCCPKIKCP